MIADHDGALKTFVTDVRQEAKGLDLDGQVNTALRDGLKKGKK